MTIAIHLVFCPVSSAYFLYFAFDVKMYVQYFSRLLFTAHFMLIAVWIVSLRFLNLYHVQTFLACSTLSRSIGLKQTFWPVCAWSLLSLSLSFFSPYLSLVCYLYVCTWLCDTECSYKFAECVWLCVCAIINFHFQLLNPFQRCMMSKYAVHVLFCHC